MYESFYGFTSRPFAAVPLTDRYFPAESIESARGNLIRCVERAEGYGLVMGPTGSGISLLCQLLASHFEQQLETVLLANLRLTNCREMLQTILYKLGIPYQTLADGELRLAIIEALSPNGRCPRGMALIVDEAHLLSPRMFEELRCMTNMVQDAWPRVRLILAGGSSLEERFAHPRLTRINQRVAVRCYLHPFTAEECYQFVRAQTDAAGTHPDRLWSLEALQAIHRCANGSPRLINQLCNHALLLAAEAKVPQLGEAEIERAWSDFQQLPTTPAPTLDEPPQCNTGTTVIEFGRLEESPAVSPEISNVPLFESETTTLNQNIVDQNTETGTLEPEAVHDQHIADTGEQEEDPATPVALADGLTPHNDQTPHAHAAHISVTDFVGIDAGHVLDIDSTSCELPKSQLREAEQTPKIDVPSTPTAPKPLKHHEPHTATTNTATTAPHRPPAIDTDFAEHLTPPGTTHSLIPVQTGMLAALVCELQETHISKSDAFKNLATQ
ncbi:MAG: AAA family ATPase [Planctomycetota bacterium]|nr:AAA family ATPase [Planctomycetota bacterium]